MCNCLGNLSALINYNLHLTKTNQNKSTENISTQTPICGLLTPEGSSRLEREKEKKPFCFTTGWSHQSYDFLTSTSQVFSSYQGPFEGFVV